MDHLTSNNLKKGNTDASLNLRPGTVCGVRDAVLSLFDTVEFSLYGRKPLSPWDQELQNVL